MIKRHELAKPNSCLNKAHVDEPLFVLKATDPMAPMTIRHWATMSENIQPEEKLFEARECAREMEDWHQRNVPQQANSGAEMRIDTTDRPTLRR